MRGKKFLIMSKKHCRRLSNIEYSCQCFGMEQSRSVLHCFDLLPQSKPVQKFLWFIFSNFECEWGCCEDKINKGTSFFLLFRLKLKIFFLFSKTQSRSKNRSKANGMPILMQTSFMAPSLNLDHY